MDEPGAQGALDQLLNEFTVETVLRDVVIPYLHDLGERVAQGVVGVGQEHFASHVIRGRLAGLARGWGGGRGPLAYGVPAGGAPRPGADGVRHRARAQRLADRLPGREHPDRRPDPDRRRTPDPELVVIAATVPERLTPIVDELRQLASAAPLALAGAGASQAIADETGAWLLAGDPVTEALRVTLRRRLTVSWGA